MRSEPQNGGTNGNKGKCNRHCNKDGTSSLTSIRFVENRKNTTYIYNYIYVVIYI